MTDQTHNNLTRFKEVKPTVNYPAMEEQILQLWRDRNVMQRSMTEREGQTPYVFFEGPPTANGRPASTMCWRAPSRISSRVTRP